MAVEVWREVEDRKEGGRAAGRYCDTKQACACKVREIEIDFACCNKVKGSCDTKIACSSHLPVATCRAPNAALS